MVRDCFKVADYALERFRKMKWNAWRNKCSTTVVFRRPSMELIEKWQLAAYKDIAHLIVMPHVTEEWVDRFMEDFRGLGLK